MQTDTITPELRQSYDALADFAAENYDTVFRPSEAGVDKAQMDSLESAGLAFLEQDGTVSLSGEHFPADHEAPKNPEISKYPNDARIAVLVESNPKRAGTKTHARFSLYAADPDTGVGPTVLEYIEAAMATGCSRAQARNDIRWDAEHGHISVG